MNGILALLGIPQSIFSPGRYVTRSGEVVTVETVGRGGILAVRGKYSDGVPERWSLSGRIFSGILTPNDIIGAAP